MELESIHMQKIETMEDNKFYINPEYRVYVKRLLL